MKTWGIVGARLVWGKVRSLTALSGLTLILMACLAPVDLYARFSDDPCESFFRGRSNEPFLINSPDQILYDLLRTNGSPPEIHHRYIARKGPMFWIVDQVQHVEPEEQMGTLQFALTNYKRNREWVFFLPAFQRDSVPGFDGVILDSHTGEPVANYTHKSSYFSIPEDASDSVMAHLSTALQKAKRFSRRESWVNMLRANDLYGTHESEVMRRYKAYVTRARSLMEFFGLDVYREEMRSRPTRILIDLIPKERKRSSLSHVVTKDLVKQVRARLRSYTHDVDKVVLQVGHEFHEIAPPKEVSSQPHFDQAM